jgi:hypothetical protein
LSGTVRLISIAPAKNIPLQRVVNQFLSDVQERLPTCRRFWWVIRGTTCLSNQWAVVPRPGQVILCAQRTSDAKQIAETLYEPETEILHVTFQGGTTEDVRLRL